MTILVVDDEPINIQVISEILSKDYDIKIAKDGLSGLEAYKKYSPSIIISDINMPKMDGIKMAKEIRNEDINTKIIFITSHHEVDYILESTSLKLTKYIFKPINKTSLLNAVSNAKKEFEKYKFISSNILIINDEYIWNFESFNLVKKGLEVNLTPSERKILNFLFSNLNKVKTYDDIILELSNEFEMPTKKSIKTIITNLRKKIPEGLISNIYAIGYKITLN